MNRRIKQVNELLKRELSTLIQQQGDTWLTITGVEVAPDLRDAKVWVSIFNANKPENNSKELLVKLQAREYSIRQKLLPRLSLKHIPKMRFEYDETVQKASRIEQLLDQVKKKKK
jgi:ribosome-binding factor A